MLPGQMLPWQMSLRQFESPRNLPLKFHQNRVRNSWDIADIEFIWGGGGVVCKVIFVSNPTQGYVRLRKSREVVGILTKNKRCWTKNAHISAQKQNFEKERFFIFCNFKNEDFDFWFCKMAEIWTFFVLTNCVPQLKIFEKYS